MIEFRRKFIAGAGILLGLLWVTDAIAVSYVPTSLDGSVSYSYGYAKAANIESETTAISMGVEMSAYIWQPWFITNSWGLSFGTSRNLSVGGSGGTSEYVTGRLNFDVFPQSRVPFSLSYIHGNSLTENQNGATRFTTNEYTTSRLLLRQTYIGRRGVYGNLTWSHVASEASSIDTTTSDNVNVNVRKRIPKHTFNGDLGYSTNDTANARAKPERVNLSASHSYVPGTSITLNSTFNMNSNKLTGEINSDANSLQFGSFFSWRPEYRNLSVSGGARLSSTESTSDTLDSTSRNFGLNLGASYQITTRVRLNANASASLADNSGVQSSSSTQSASISFSSEQYLLLGYSYGYGMNSAVSNSYNDTDGAEANTDQTVAFGINHRANRSWNVGRASSLNLGLAQGGSIFESVSADAEPTRSITHSANVGLSTRGRSGTTYMSWTFSDSRTFTDLESQFQQLSMSLSRSQTLNRLSTLNASATMQTSRQAGDNLPTKTISNARMSARYLTSRFFGIYAMPYNSTLTYARPMTDGVVGEESIDWENKIDYKIGLLTMNLSFNTRKTGTQEPTYTMYFRATRTF